MNSESSIIAKKDRTAKRQPTCRKPSANSGRLIKKLIRPTPSGTKLASTVAMPVTPPGAMSCGRKNQTKDIAVSSAPATISA